MNQSINHPLKIVVAIMTIRDPFLNTSLSSSSSTNICSIAEGANATIIVEPLSNSTLLFDLHCLSSAEPGFGTAVATNPMYSGLQLGLSFHSLS
mmetsp:Transcript_31414/g.75750  ORF Transcript_31414/g.75750 Transcript_31414/m.75750 type:complete len:94 (-) Transcript_31414:1526-1807(-)